MSTGPAANTPAPAAAERDAKRKESAAAETAAYGLPEAGAFSLVSLAMAGDISVAVNRPKAFVALQRLAGNRAVAGSFLPPPTGSTGNGNGKGHHRRPAVVQRQVAAASVKSYGYNGLLLSTDKAGVRLQMEGIVERGGMEELRKWFASWGGLGTAEKNSMAALFQISSEEVVAIDAAVVAAKNELEEDARVYIEGLKPAARAVTEGILADSRKLIEGELDKYGISEKQLPDEGGGGSAGGPPSYKTEISFTNQAKGREAQERAKGLAETRRAADKADKAFTDMVAVPGYSEMDKAVQKSIPELETKYKAAEELWKMQEDLYAKEAQAATTEFPVLAIYASGDNAASKLEGFAKQPIEQLGEALWREAKTRLENIDTVREGLDDRFKPLHNERIAGLVLGKPDTQAWQKKVGQDAITAGKEKAEQDKMFWATVAIGLGLIAAIPTGGASLAATGIVTAAAVAGAALSVYNAYDHWKEYQVQSAAANTHFAKAQSISQDEPSFFWVAIDIVSAGLELGAAAAAFKSVVAAVKEARTTRDVLKMAKAVDAAAPPACAGKIKATVAAELGPEAIDGLIKAEGAAFRSGDLLKVRKSLEQSAIGGWTEAYDAMAAQRKIRPLSEESLEQLLGHLPAKDPAYTSLASEYIMKHRVLRNQGIYSPETGIIFVKPGSQHTIANVVAHEMVHAGQARLGENLNNFWAEFEAYSAQKRIIRQLDNLGVGAHIDPEVGWLREASDADIAMHIRAHYGYPIPPGVGGFGEGDKQVARGAIAAAKKILAVGGM